MNYQDTLSFVQAQIRTRIVHLEEQIIPANIGLLGQQVSSLRELAGLYKTLGQRQEALGALEAALALVEAGGMPMNAEFIEADIAALEAKP